MTVRDARAPALVRMRTIWRFRIVRWLVMLAVAMAAIALWPAQPLSRGYLSSTAIYDAAGGLMRLTLAPDQRYRVWADLEQISPLTREAFLLHEDRYFYFHPGVNPVALARGFYATYIAKERRIGGSTITMQLARKRYAIDSHTFTGKVQQILRAVQLELLYSKDEILEAYLNVVPFSGNIEGVAAASQIYFAHPASRATLAEALTLAVIPQNPSVRGPRKHTPKPLVAARARLYSAWLSKNPQTVPGLDLHVPLQDSAQLPFVAPHVTQMLLAGQVGAPHIETTIDRRLQHLLERHANAYVMQRRHLGIKNTAVLLLDHRSMEVKAALGSVDFHNRQIFGQVNGIQAKRSPGSTLKPFIYALAIDQGVIHPLSVLRDSPQAFGPYTPENFDGEFLGPVSARDALVRSRNIPAIAVAAKLSNPDFYSFLKSAGIADMRSKQHYGLALVLGGGEVTMEELVSLYAALANEGQQRPLRYLRDQTPAPAQRLFSAEASFMTLDMLKDNPRPDGGFIGSPTLPVYWKTGTSYGFRDAWAVGIFGPYVLAVWVGNFEGGGNPAFIGAQAAAPLFFRITDAIHAQNRRAVHVERKIPAGVKRVVVCAATGDLPNAECPVRVRTWFIPGKSPIRLSRLHRVAGSVEQGCVARREVYEYWPSDLRGLFEQAGLPRRMPPALDGCAAAEPATYEPPQITSPLRGASYEIKAALQNENRIAFKANAAGDVAELFWFVNNQFAGKTAAGKTLYWQPSHSGEFTVRVLDQFGRSDARRLRIVALR